MERRPRGQLREMILDEAHRLLFSTGDVDSVSIDALVAAVGCTPPALYYYFETKEELIREVGRRQYQRFAADLETALPDTDDPLEELRARGHAYLDWGRGHPEHYRILFMTPHPTPDEMPDPASVPGLAELVANLGRAAAAGLLEVHDPLETALAFWSVVHGITAIAVVNPLIPPETAHGVLAANTEALIRQYAA